MKKLNIITIISFCLIIITTGCTRHRYPQQLVFADSIAVTKPDSCIKILKKIEPAIHTAKEEDRMYYNLIKVKAQNHAYIKPANDSIITGIIEYYENRGNENMLPAAYFYAGRVYEGLNNYPQAMKYFQKTLKLVENVENNSEYLRIKDKTYCQLGNIFYDQWLDDDALKMYQESYKISKMRKDTRGMIFNLRDIASTYSNKGKPDSAIYYYNQALVLAKKQNNKDMYADVSGQIARLYYNLGNYKEARKRILPAIKYVDSNNNEAVLLIAARIYDAENRTDTAELLYKELLKFSSVYVKQEAFKGLVKYDLKRNNYQDALYHIENCELYFDSIQNITATKTVAQMNALYNYESREKESLQLKIEAKKKEFIFTIIIAAAFFIISILSGYIIYKRLNNKIIKYKKEKYVSPNTQIQKEAKEKELQIKESDIYQMIVRIFNNPNAKKRLTDDEWEQLRTTINDIYKGFDDKLSELCKMSTLDYRVCLLIKIKIPLSDIAELVNKTNTGISSIRTKLYERAFGEKKGTKAWDEIITSL